MNNQNKTGLDANNFNSCPPAVLRPLIDPSIMVRANRSLRLGRER